MSIEEKDERPTNCLGYLFSRDWRWKAFKDAVKNKENVTGYGLRVKYGVALGTARKFIAKIIECGYFDQVSTIRTDKAGRINQAGLDLYKTIMDHL